MPKGEAYPFREVPFPNKASRFYIRLLNKVGEIGCLSCLIWEASPREAGWAFGALLSGSLRRNEHVVIHVALHCSTQRLCALVCI